MKPFIFNRHIINKSNLFAKICCIALGIVIVVGCEENLLNENYRNTPTDNYELFWSEFDQFYGMFEVKNIQWDSLKNVYNKTLSDNSTERQLYVAMCGLLNELNDGHADLYAPSLGYYRSWNRRNKSYFSDARINDIGSVEYLQNTIKANYLLPKFEKLDIDDWLFFWGIINYKSLKVGYICLPTFNLSEYPHEFIQQAIDTFNQNDAVIIDLRFNGGGKTEAFVRSLNGFSNRETLYLKSKFRDGKEHTDFTELKEHWTKPRTNSLKAIPVAILMNSYSASSSDHFILGMKSQPNVITVGDTTCGAFSSVLERVLPNGWKYRLGAQVVYATDGSKLSDRKGNYLEGIGIAPDYYITDRWNAVVNGRDMPLEKALLEVSKRVP